MTEKLNSCGICGTCNHIKSCFYYTNNLKLRQTVFRCEEFDDFQITDESITKKRIGDTLKFIPLTYWGKTIS